MYLSLMKADKQVPGDETIHPSQGRDAAFTVKTQEERTIHMNPPPFIVHSCSTEQ